MSVVSINIRCGSRDKTLWQHAELGKHNDTNKILQLGQQCTSSVIGTNWRANNNAGNSDNGNETKGRREEWLILRAVLRLIFPHYGQTNTRTAGLMYSTDPRLTLRKPTIRTNSEHLDKKNKQNNTRTRDNPSQKTRTKNMLKSDHYFPSLLIDLPSLSCCRREITVEIKLFDLAGNLQVIPLPQTATIYCSTQPDLSTHLTSSHMYYNGKPSCIKYPSVIQQRLTASPTSANSATPTRR